MERKLYRNPPLLEEDDEDAQPTATVDVAPPAATTATPAVTIVSNDDDEEELLLPSTTKPAKQKNKSTQPAKQKTSAKAEKPAKQASSTPANKGLLLEDDEEELSPQSTTQTTTSKSSAVQSSSTQQAEQQRAENKRLTEEKVRAEAEVKRLTKEKTRTDSIADAHKTEAMRLAKEKAKQDNIIAEQKAEVEHLNKEKTEQEHIIAEQKAEVEHLNKEKAEQERIIAEQKAEVERLNKEKAEQDHIIAEQNTAAAQWAKEKAQSDSIEIANAMSNEVGRKRMAADKAILDSLVLALQMENEQIKRRLEQTETEKADVLRQKAEADSAIITAHKEIERLKAENEESLKQISVLKETASNRQYTPQVAVPPTSQQTAASATPDNTISTINSHPSDTSSVPANTTLQTKKLRHRYYDYSGKGSITIFSVGYSTYFLLPGDGVDITEFFAKRHFINFDILEWRAKMFGMSLLNFEMGENTQSSTLPQFQRGGKTDDALEEATRRTMWFAYKPSAKIYIPIAKWLAIEMYGGIEVDVTGVWSKINSGYYKSQLIPQQNYFVGAFGGLGFQLTGTPVIPLEIKAEYRNPIKGNTAIAPQGVYLSAQLHMAVPVRRTKKKQITNLGFY